MRVHSMFGAALAVALFGCATTPDIRTSADTTADFSRYHSYSWATAAAPNGIDPSIYDRVHTSIDRALAARSFTLAPDGDFAVAFTLGRRDSVQVSDYGAYAPYYSPWDLGPSYHMTDIRQITEGTLVIDIYDSRSHRPVWHGIATQQINPANIDPAAVDAAIDAVLAKFPPS